MDPPTTPEEFEALGREYLAAVGRAKEQRARLRETKAALMAYMQRNRVEAYDLGDGAKILCKPTKRTEGLKKEHIEGELRGRLPEEVKEVVENIYNRRVTEVQDVLVITQPRG